MMSDLSVAGHRMPVVSKDQSKVTLCQMVQAHSNSLAMYGRLHGKKSLDSWQEVECAKWLECTPHALACKERHGRTKEFVFTAGHSSRKRLKVILLKKACHPSEDLPIVEKPCTQKDARV
eukprot:3198861-Amphidinium_carterae.2